MTRWTQLIHLPAGTKADDVKAALDRAVAASPMVARHLLEPMLPGSRGGGDLLWHLQFRDEAARQECIRQSHWRGEVTALLRSMPCVDSAVYEPGRGGVHQPGIANGVYRTLLLKIEDGTPAETTARFERELAAMPDYIDTIRNWTLSRVSEGGGQLPWTHVWEQEYATLEGLTGLYMMHPYHWGFVDRWFDPEMAGRIVAIPKCHVFCRFHASVLS